MNAKEILDAFARHGEVASFHYAAETSNEIADAIREKRAALALFDANPDLQPRMRDVARGFLWSLNQERA